MSHSVRQHLRLDVADYDRTIRRFIPGYETMLGVAADAVAAVTPGRVLDLGAGTAALSECVLERTAQETVVELWDVDEEMLEQASARLERFGHRAVRRVRSYLDPFPECDAIMASLALHHIPDMAQKSELYQRAHAAIRPGGVLVNADATMPAPKPQRTQLFVEWAAHMVRQGLPEADAWKHFEEWSEEDTYQPLDVEVGALEDAGFMVTVPFRKAASTVIVATRF